LNHRKKTKADGSRLIPRKHTETLVLLSVSDPCLFAVNTGIKRSLKCWSRNLVFVRLFAMQ